MVVTNTSKYKEICDHISASQCSVEQLQHIKQKYVDTVNSKRRWDSISTLAQLLQILEKRDCLSPSKIEPLKYIESKLHNPTLSRLVSNYNNPNYNNVPLNNIIYRERPVPVLPNVPSDVKERVYHCIASDIGQKWVDFARALDIREGAIDNLDVHRKSSVRVHEILRYHEQCCDPRHWRTELLEALTKARRSDLRRQVQSIFDQA